MKKIVGIIAAAALATSAFAEVNIGLSANQAFAPIAYNGDEIVTVGPDANWGNLNTGKNVGRIGISFSAGNDVAGVVTDIHNEDGTHDNAYGWVKPFSFLKISAGKLDAPWTRLGFGYGAWNTLRPNVIGSEGDDLAFWRPHQPNFQVLLTPVEGLEIVWDYKAEDSKYHLYDEVWNHARFGASYAIEGVGKILAQVWGKDMGCTDSSRDGTNWGVINAAFQLTAVEGLDAQFGVRVPTTFKPTTSKILTGAAPSASDFDADSAVQFGAGVNYKLDPVTLHAFFDGRLSSEVADCKNYNKFGFGIGGGVDFALTDAYTLIADVRYYSTYYTPFTEGKDHVVFYGGMEHHLSNATLKLGFAGSTNSLIHDKKTDKGEVQSFTFGIPLVLDISF